MTDARDDRAIQRRAEELASVGMEDGDNHYADWLQAQRNLFEIADAAVAHWYSPNDNQLDRCVGLLREKFIQECAGLYREQAEDEAREQAEIEHENAAGDEGKERAWSEP